MSLSKAQRVEACPRVRLRLCENAIKERILKRLKTTLQNVLFDPNG